MKVLNPQYIRTYIYIYLMVITTLKMKVSRGFPWFFGGWDPRTWIAPWFGWITSPGEADLLRAARLGAAGFGRFPGGSPGGGGIQGSLKMNQHVIFGTKNWVVVSNFLFVTLPGKDFQFWLICFKWVETTKLKIGWKSNKMLKSMVILGT